MNINELAAGIESFYETLSNNKERITGSFDKRTVPLDVNSSEIKLSEELKYLYGNYDVDFSFNVYNIAFTRFEGLENRQQGFKYISNDNGKTFEVNKDWNKDWLVIADMNDDPIVADTGVAGAPVYAAIEAQNYMKIAPSLAVLFMICTALLKTLEIYGKDEPDSDEDYDAYENYLEEIIKPNFLERINKIIDNECANNLKEFLYG